VAEAHAAIVAHLADHHAFYGEAAGVRIARKHLGWYTRDLAVEAFRREINTVELVQRQRAPSTVFSDTLARAASTSTIARHLAAVVDARRVRTAATTSRGGEALAA
jgi:tRNA-dihydrouridine synthase B